MVTLRPALQGMATGYVSCSVGASKSPSGYVGCDSWPRVPSQGSPDVQCKKSYKGSRDEMTYSDYRLRYRHLITEELIVLACL